MRNIFGLLSTLSFLLAMPAFADVNAGQHQDEQDIRAFIQSLNQSVTQGDLDATLSAFSETADVVDPKGSSAEGREQIKDLLEPWVQAFQGGTMTMPEAPIRFLAPGIAIVDGHCKWTQTAQNEGQEPTMSTAHVTAILKKQNGQWLIEALRVFLVVE